MKTPLAAALALCLPLCALPAISVEAPLILSLGAAGNAERNVVRYECEDGVERAVTYINAAPNFLALVPVEDQTLVMAAGLAASGVRYAAGQYVWWSAGPEGDLYDLTEGEDAAPIAHCFEITETP